MIFLQEKFVLFPIFIFLTASFSIGDNVGLARRDVEGLNETALDLLLSNFGTVDEQSLQANQSNLT